MNRKFIKMYLKPGFEEEDQKKNQKIWPELKKLMKNAGICDYSIFWD